MSNLSLKQALLELLQVVKKNHYTKSEVDEIKTNINENINNEKQELTNTIESVNSTLNSRIDNLSSSQEKALENAINDVKNDTANAYTNKVEYNTHKIEFENFVKNVNALLSSDDTTLDTLQEIVNYIKNNKDLLDGITVNKINYSDIVDNLQTALTNKVLSANQGVVLKQLIDELNNSKANKETIGQLNNLTTTNKSNIVESINEVNTKQNILQPQKPKGTYENLSALQTAYPSGASGVYLTSDNGHWYFWNGTQYVDGGIYQATQINESNIDNILSIYTKKLTPDTTNSIQGYYNDTGYHYDPNYKCATVDITDFNKIKVNVEQGPAVELLWVYDSDNNKSSIGLPLGLSIIDISNYVKMEVNFYDGNYGTLFVLINDINNDIPTIKNEIKSKLNVEEYKGLEKTYSINELELYQDNAFVNTDGSITSTISGRKVYKLDLTDVEYLYIIRGAEDPQVGMGRTFDYDNAKGLFLNTYDTYIKVKGYKYVLLNWWGSNGDDVFAKNIKVVYKNAIDKLYDKNIKSVIKKPFDFNNKNAIFFGDSITKGYTSGTTTTTENYVKLFSEKVGLNYNNQGIAGSTIGVVSGLTNIVDKVKITSNLNNYDYLFVAGGINDWARSVTLSDFSSKLEELCDYLKTNYSGEVIFIAPINHLDIISSGWNNIESEDSYRNIIGRYALKYNFSFVNGGEFNFPQKISAYNNLFYGDGLHPSELGYQLYANSLLTLLC